MDVISILFLQCCFYIVFTLKLPYVVSLFSYEIHYLLYFSVLIIHVHRMLVYVTYNLSMPPPPPP